MRLSSLTAHRRRYQEGDEDLDHDSLVKKLEDMGFQLSEIEDVPDETLAAILRVVGQDQDEDDFDESGVGAPQNSRRGRVPDDDDGGFDEEDREDAALEDLPEPADEEERKVFAERGRHWIRRGQKVLRRYADDNNSGALSGGALGRGTSTELQPVWDAARYREEYKRNENGLKQMGVTSPEALRAHREGKRVVHCDAPPRQAREGRGLSDQYSERPAANCQELFQRNEAGLRQLGVTSAAELKRRLDESRRG
jgi:hypothetical protein